MLFRIYLYNRYNPVTLKNIFLENVAAISLTSYTVSKPRRLILFDDGVDEKSGSDLMFCIVSHLSN